MKKGKDYIELNFLKTPIRQIVGPPPRPLVTSCCGSLQWVNAVHEKLGGVYYCGFCEQICKIDFITLEQYNIETCPNLPPLSKLKTKWKKN